MSDPPIIRIFVFVQPAPSTPPPAPIPPAWSPPPPLTSSSAPPSTSYAPPSTLVNGAPIRIAVVFVVWLTTVGFVLYKIVSSYTDCTSLVIGLAAVVGTSIAAAIGVLDSGGSGSPNPNPNPQPNPQPKPRGNSIFLRALLSALLMSHF